MSISFNAGRCAMLRENMKKIMCGSELLIMKVLKLTVAPELINSQPSVFQTDGAPEVINSEPSVFHPDCCARSLVMRCHGDCCPFKLKPSRSWRGSPWQ